MSRLGWVALALVLVHYEAHVEAQDASHDSPQEYAPPRATATLLTPATIWVNQKAEIEVTLWRDEAKPDKAPPAFGEIRVANAIALPTDYGPPPDIRTEEGLSYLLQKRRYLVFPQAVGVIEVPPIPVSWTADDGSRARVETEPVQFEARFPPAAENEYVVANALTLTESIDGDLDRIRVGDSFTRTLTIEAADTDAMMIPVVTARAPAGLRAYPSTPEVSTTVYRGTYRAKRTEATTYVAEDWGRTELPAVAVQWLNPTTGQWQTETLEARRFRVRANPELGLTALGTLEGSGRRVGGLIVVLLLVWGSYLLWRGRPRLGRFRLPQASVERRLFGRLLRAAKRDDAMRTLNATYAWLSAPSVTDDEPPTLEMLGEHIPAAKEHLVDLQRTLFSKDSQTEPWKGRAFAASMRKARSARSSPGAKQRDKLPPLNPRP